MADAPAEKRTEYLTARQLAEHLQVSEATVRRLRQRGLIPAVRLTDRLVRYNLKDVRAALSRAASKQRGAEPEVEPGPSAQMEFSDLLAEFESSNETEGRPS
jgi:excisionase family DNA binding protein